MKINSITQFIISDWWHCWHLRSFWVLILLSMCSICLDYTLMMQYIMIWAHINPCERFFDGDDWSWAQWRQQLNYLSNLLALTAWTRRITSLNLDDAGKVTSEPHDTCTLKIAHAQHKREDLAESIDVVPVKYPPKVKLGLLTTLEC